MSSRTISDADFLRYQRQVSLPEIGEEGQHHLVSASVLVIGCGGLGSAALMYLAGAGIGKIVIADNDVVDVSNLHRQTVYREEDVGVRKVDAMKRQLNALNPQVSIRTINKRMDSFQLGLEVSLADIVLDCSDNFESRHQLNGVCYKYAKPLVSGAAIGWNGQVAMYSLGDDMPSTKGCYECLYPKEDGNKQHQVNARCSDLGVIGPIVGLIGNMQALLTIQYLAGVREQISTSKIHLFSGQTMQWQQLTIPKDPSCSVCGAHLETDRQVGN